MSDDYDKEQKLQQSSVLKKSNKPGPLQPSILNLKSFLVVASKIHQEKSVLVRQQKQSFKGMS